MKAFEVGARVVWPGQGLGRIEALEEKGGEPHFGLKMDSGMAIWVPVEKAPSAMWPLPTRPEAEELLARLREPAAPDPRPFAERFKTFQKIALDGSLDAYLDFTRSMLAAGRPESFGERKMLLTLQDTVFAPLAEVLGREVDALVDEVLAAQEGGALPPAVPGNAPAEARPAPGDPEAPRPAGHDYLGTFEGSGDLVVGDPVYLPEAGAGKAHPGGAVGSERIDAPAARWHAYARLNEDDECTHLLALRADLEDGPRTMASRAEEVAMVWVDGGRVAIVDAACCEDEKILEDFFLANEAQVALFFGAMANTGGDGTFPVFVTRDGRGAAYVEIDLR